MNNQSYLLILSREHNKNIDILSSLPYEKKVIYDDIENDIYYKNNGFIGMTRMIKQPSSWDKAFYYLYTNQHLLNKYNSFYIIEDDVYTKDINTLYDTFTKLNQTLYDFLSLKINSRQNTKQWCWWTREKDVDRYFKNPYMSFNPLCRLSARLINKILEFKNKHNKFYFHEIMFSSLCVENNFTLNNINSIIESSFGQFDFRPIIDINTIVDKKIYHPVKPVYKKKYFYHST